MRILRLGLAFLLSLSLCLGLIPSAFAAEFQIIPYTFTLTPDQCPDLDTTIYGSGEYFTRINVRTDKNGVTYIINNSTTSGIATDDLGNTYRYNYSNTQKIEILNSPPFQIKMTDHFNLVGAGGLNKLHVGFVYYITDLTGDGPLTPDDIIVAVNERSVLACDPI